MDLVAIVKERAEGKDLSVLGGSVKFVVDESVVLIDGNSGEISSDDNEATCTISTDADTMPVSYTHLTLPTNREV